MPTTAKVTQVERIKTKDGRTITLVTIDLGNLEARRLNPRVRIVRNDGKAIEANATFGFSKPIDAPALFTVDVDAATEIPIGSRIEFSN